MFNNIILSCIKILIALTAMRHCSSVHCTHLDLGMAANASSSHSVSQPPTTLLGCHTLSFSKGLPCQKNWSPLYPFYTQTLVPQPVLLPTGSIALVHCNNLVYLIHWLIVKCLLHCCKSECNFFGLC